MRIKISFLRTFKSSDSLPLHHQNTVYRFLKEYMPEKPDNKTFITYSTVKGTVSIAEGYIKYQSTKVSLVIASNNDDFLQTLVNNIFRQRTIAIGKMELYPKQKIVVEMPQYKSVMKYVCISPIILIDPKKEPMRAADILDPASHEFSDLLFNSTIERMEESGYSEEELSEFVSFQAIADADYLIRIAENNKRYTRYYKNLDDQIIHGYLFPFALHAHPKVQEFICNCGIGYYCYQGFGMVDVVRMVPQSVENSEIKTDD